MKIIKQDLFSLCKIGYKQIIKETKNPLKVPEYVKNSDGTNYLRSSKDRELDEQIEPLAEEFCKGFKKDKNNKKYFIIP